MPPDPGTESRSPGGPDRPATHRLVSSCDGRITSLLICLPRYALQHTAYYRVYERIIREFRDTSFVCLTHESALEQCRSLFAASPPAGLTLIRLREDANCSTWVSDIGLAAQHAHSQPPVLLTPIDLVRGHDSALAPLMSSQTTTAVQRTPLYFEGGNALIGDDYWLLGADSLYESMRLNPDFATGQPTALEWFLSLCREHLDATRRLELIRVPGVVPAQCELPMPQAIAGWRQLVYRGNRDGTVQPTYHLDLFITLAGRDAAGRPLIFVGDPALAWQTLNWPTSEHALADGFDEIAAVLTRSGVNVVRIPMPLVYDDDRRARLRRWYFASYNNAIVEIDHDFKRVWLPTFGHGIWRRLHATDEVAAALWRTHGFEVVMMPDMHTPARDLGGLRCLAMPLSRREPSPA